MTLTDLQVELRNIEEHISQLHTEIEKMKPQTNEQKKKDFETITKLAKQHPIDGIEISNASEVLQKEFVKGLSYLLTLEEKDIYPRLLYLSRLAIGCGLKETAEDIYKLGLEFEVKDIEKICNDLQQYKYSFLIESFIIANFSEATSINMLTVIADIASMMDLDKEEIQVLALVAKSRLLKNLEILKTMSVSSVNKWSGKLGDYIPKELIISQRIECVTICTEKNLKIDWDSIYERMYAKGKVLKSITGKKSYYTKTPCVIEQQLQSGSFVKSGDTIFIYKEGIATKVTKTIKAPKDGIVFFIEEEKKGEVEERNDKYLAVYVV